MKKRLLAISDIHGCCSEFIALLKRAAYNPLLDQLILLGDYVDRGPDSFQVVELVIQLVNEGAIALRGNHDDYFVKMVKENNRFSYNIIGWRQTESSYAHVDSSLLNKHIRFMDSLPCSWTTEDYFFSHAGINPNRALEDQDPEDLLWIREPWLYSFYSPTDKTVVFGHSITDCYFPQHGIYRDLMKIAINTGGGCGGYLSLVDLDNEVVYTSHYSQAKPLTKISA